MSRTNVAAAYDASSVVFRVARAFGCGPMLNLGYYRFPAPLTPLNFLTALFESTTFLRLPAAQLALLNKSIALLNLTSGSRVLDVACGRGMSSFLMATTCPLAHVTAIDLLPQSVDVARTLYVNIPNLKYLQGDAMNLGFRDQTFDRVLCLEAAFHFPDRARFLRELARVTGTGARVVIVDFMTATDADGSFWDEADTTTVRQVWQFETFDSVRQYQSNARDNGFEIEACHDWSPHVTIPLLTILGAIAWLGQREWGRQLMARRNPVLRGLPRQDWEELGRSVQAHRHVHRQTKYVALVLRKAA